MVLKQCVKWNLSDQDTEDCASVTWGVPLSFQKSSLGALMARLGSEGQFPTVTSGPLPFCSISPGLTLSTSQNLPLPHRPCGGLIPITLQDLCNRTALPPPTLVLTFLFLYESWKLVSVFLAPLWCWHRAEKETFAMLKSDKDWLVQGVGRWGGKGEWIQEILRKEKWQDLMVDYECEGEGIK